MWTRGRKPRHKLYDLVDDPAERAPRDDPEMLDRFYQRLRRRLQADREISESLHDESTAPVQLGEEARQQLHDLGYLVD
jgi:hypothetical protein